MPFACLFRIDANYSFIKEDYRRITRILPRSVPRVNCKFAAQYHPSSAGNYNVRGIVRYTYIQVHADTQDALTYRCTTVISRVLIFMKRKIQLPVRLQPIEGCINYEFCQRNDT